MPFVAERDDKDQTLINASEIEETRVPLQSFTCPSCSGELRYRDAATNDEGEKIRRAHFWHTDNVGKSGGVGGCAAGGESARHEEIKGQVVRHFRRKGETNVYAEKQVGSRIADVLVEREEVYRDDEPANFVVEIQCKNEGKDYLKTTKEYLRHDCGVYWVFDITDGFEMLFETTLLLSEYVDAPIHFGQADEDNLGLGTCVYFDNFKYIVTSLEDEFFLSSITPEQYSLLSHFNYGDFEIAGNSATKQIYARFHGTMNLLT